MSGSWKIFLGLFVFALGSANAFSKEANYAGTTCKGNTTNAFPVCMPDCAASTCKSASGNFTEADCVTCCSVACSESSPTAPQGAYVYNSKDDSDCGPMSCWADKEKLQAKWLEEAKDKGVDVGEFLRNDKYNFDQAYACWYQTCQCQKHGEKNAINPGSDENCEKCCKKACKSQIKD